VALTFALGSFGVPWSLCFEQGYFRGRVGAGNGLRFLLVLRFCFFGGCFGDLVGGRI